MYGSATDRLDPSWSTWYPDSFAQVWPVWSLTATPARRAASWAAFTAHWPTWADSTPLFGATSVEHSPNAAVALAAATVGDTASVDSYLRVSEVNWAGRGRPPPWTVDDSGFRALAARAALGP